MDRKVRVIVFGLALALLTMMLGPSAMAVISFDGAAEDTNGYTPSGNMTAAMPLGVAVGDVCIAHLIVTGSNTLAIPTGWNLIREDWNQVWATQGLYWHVVVPSEPATYTWTTGGEVYYEAGIGCYSGVNTSSPMDPASPNGAMAIATGPSITVPSISTQYNGDLLIAAVMDSEGSFGQGASISLPSPFVMRWNFTDATANYLAGTLGDTIQANAGVAPSIPITVVNGSASDNLIGAQLALVDAGVVISAPTPTSTPTPTPTAQPTTTPTPTPTATPTPPPPGSISLIGTAQSSSSYTATGIVALTMPSAIPAGSVCLAQLAATGSNTFTVPSGWKTIRVDVNGYQATQGLYWHTTGANEASSYTWTTQGAVYFEGGIACYSNVNTTSPIDSGAPKGVAATAIGTSLVVPSITTKRAGALIVGTFMDSESSFGQHASINPPAGLTTRWSFTDSAANYLAATVGDKVQNVAGATGTLAISITNGSSHDNLIGAQVALDHN